MKLITRSYYLAIGDCELSQVRESYKENQYFMRWDSLGIVVFEE